MALFDKIRAMANSSLKRIVHQIERIKEELLLIGEMRPGSLTKQYRQPKEKKGGFYQISYTYKMKSKTEYVRPQHLDDLKRQVETYQKFKGLIEEWIDLAITHSKLKIQIDNRNQEND